uniref:Uncharacterized protein n=1 Tax=Manihot esculenta TaxID=3983 RepID=A0A2C9UGD3_MANES
MDKKEMKEDTIDSHEDRGKAVREIKGVVDDEPPHKMEDTDKKSVKRTTEEVKRLPHQQVPQPGDFSTELLEQL